MPETTEGLSCLICLFSYLINYSDGLTYTISEEIPIGSPVGNVALNHSFTDSVTEDVFKQLQYHILNVDENFVTNFQINSSTSVLSTAKRIDREEICASFASEFSCSLLIRLAATHPTVSFFEPIEVTVVIEDINDHEPEFKNNPLDLSILESELPGTKLSIDQAVDLDSTIFSVKSYEIQPDNTPFSISFETEDSNSILNIVLEQDLDREKMDKYAVQVVAVDGGSKPLSGTLSVNIAVTDFNDNYPQFPETEYNVTVKEGIAVNSTLLILRATDSDIEENGRISYSLAAFQASLNKDLFWINETSGEFKVADQLTYTQGHEVYKVKVEASDGGSPPKVNHTFVNVHVQDSENKAPEINVRTFSGSDDARVSESANVGKAVAYVTVKDTDSNRNGEVSCSVNGTHFGLQLQEGKNFKVIVLRSLNREETGTHVLAITCSDFGVPKLSSTEVLVVSVLDENDNFPVFSKPQYNASLEENSPIGSVIQQVSAMDKDTGLNGEIQYSIPTRYTSLFNINKDDGTIRAMDSFDRENKTSYEFYVIATDKGSSPLSSTASVFLEILDVNDNAPVFDRTEFDYFVQEGRPIGTILGEVTAKDNDTGNNAVISYSVSGLDDDSIPFTILPHDGTLKTTDELDREVKEVYYLNVTATDKGTPETKSTSTNVTVYVEDKNDHVPIIIRPEDEDEIFYISYLSPVRTQVTQIRAYDADDGRNAEIMFVISDRNDSGIFEVGVKGEIIIAKTMHLSNIQKYFLTIKVYNPDSPEVFSEKRIILIITENTTSLTVQEADLAKQNMLIAILVVVVTLIIGASILLTIWIIRRLDHQKRLLDGQDSTPPSSSADTSDLKLDTIPSVTFSADLPHISPDHPDGMLKHCKSYQESRQPNGILKNGGDGGVGDGQDTKNSQHIHRLASLRLQQALLHNKQWLRPNESLESRDGRKQDDHQSEISGESETCDSGRGGSLSDTGDIRLMQLQQVVRPSGRKDNPPPYKDIAMSTQPPNVPPRGKAFGKVSARSPSQSPTRSPIQSHIRSSTNHQPLTTSPRQKVLDLDLLPHKHFEEGLKGAKPRYVVDETMDSMATTYYDDDDSTTSGSYYIDHTMDDLSLGPPHGRDVPGQRVNDVYV